VGTELRRRTRAESRADNRAALLRAAGELIVEVGYASAQLDEIAARAGLTKGAIYSIFGGKLELLRELVDDHARHVLPLLGLDITPDDGQTAEDVVTRLAEVYVAFCRRDDARSVLAFELDLAGLALRDQPTLDRILLHEHAQADELATVLTDRPRRDGKPLDSTQAAVAADLVLGALGGFGHRSVTMPSVARDAGVVAHALCALLDVAADA
jgi:AcrR family transcriptional regulator